MARQGLVELPERPKLTNGDDRPFKTLEHLDRVFVLNRDFAMDRAVCETEDEVVTVQRGDQD